MESTLLVEAGTPMGLAIPGTGSGLWPHLWPNADDSPIE